MRSKSIQNVNKRQAWCSSSHGHGTLVGCWYFHPELRSVYHGSRPLVVADQPFSLVPNDEARKDLRNPLLVSTYPRAAKDQHSIIVSRSGLNRLPRLHVLEFLFLLSPASCIVHTSSNGQINIVARDVVNGEDMRGALEFKQWVRRHCTLY